MAEPFVFHFRPDAAGHPERMFLVDLMCGCSTCGAPVIQRFYHALPLHQTTFHKLIHAIHHAHHKAQCECEQCGAPITHAEVSAACVRAAFADDTGEIVAFLSDFATIDGPHAQFQLIPHRRLDPQVQPTFSPDPALPILNALTDDDLVMTLDRPWNTKEAWRMLAQGYMRSDQDAGFTSHITPGSWLVIAQDEAMAARVIRDPVIAQVQQEESLQWISLADSLPESLPTYQRTASLSGAWRKWLPAEMTAALDAHRAFIWVGVSSTRADQVITRAFDTARLVYERVVEEESGDVCYDQIATPRGELLGEPLLLSQVLRRAAYTGLSPGEAARLTAEEIVGVMLQVWQPHRPDLK